MCPAESWGYSLSYSLTLIPEKAESAERAKLIWAHCFIFVLVERNMWNFRIGKVFMLIMVPCIEQFERGKVWENKRQCSGAGPVPTLPARHGARQAVAEVQAASLERGSSRGISGLKRRARNYLKGLPWCPVSDSAT